MQHHRSENGSRSTLQAAFLKLQALQLGLERVRRVAVQRKGTLHIEVHESGTQRFFVYECGELQEIKVETDPKIPFVMKRYLADIATDHVIISYRPGRRVVLSSVGREQDTIIKAYKRHKAALAAEKYALVSSACAAGGFDVPALLQVEADGDYLRMVKRAGHTPAIDRDSVGIWADIGSYLKHFQQLADADGLEMFGPAKELAVLDERARRFLLCLPELPTGWQDSRGKLQALVSGLPPATHGLAHRDLHDRQLIVSDSKTISVLDFDLVCVADVALDAANLLAHMKLRTLQRNLADTPTALRDCSDAFLQGLARQHETGFELRLLFYQASTYLRLALLYAIRPRWMHLTPPLIAEADHCIDRLNASQVSS